MNTRVQAGLPFLTAAAALLLAACGGSSRDQGAPGAGTPGYEPMSYATETFERTSGECAGPGTPCGRFAIAFPRAEAGADDSTRARVNRLVRHLVATGALQSDTTHAFEAMAANFLGQYERAREEFPDAASTASWTLEITASALFDAPGLVSLQLQEYVFTGGAHPNSRTVLRTFRTGDGSPLFLSDIAAPDAGPELERLGERRFREIRGIPQDTPLAEAGFFDDTQGRFRFPEDVAVVEEGLRFFYNPYDIAPYAAGPTGLILPWDEVRPLLRPGTPVAAVAGI